MFKNILIGMFVISTLVFGALAIRNATPRTCDELVRSARGNLICLTNLGDATEDDAQEALTRIQEEYWRW